MKPLVRVPFVDRAGILACKFVRAWGRRDRTCRSPPCRHPAAAPPSSASMRRHDRATDPHHLGSALWVEREDLDRFAPAMIDDVELLCRRGRSKIEAVGRKFRMSAGPGSRHRSACPTAPAVRPETTFSTFVAAIDEVQTATRPAFPPSMPLATIHAVPGT